MFIKNRFVIKNLNRYFIRIEYILFLLKIGTYLLSTYKPLRIIFRMILKMIVVMVLRLFSLMYYIYIYIYINTKPFGIVKVDTLATGYKLLPIPTIFLFWDDLECNKWTH